MRKVILVLTLGLCLSISACSAPVRSTPTAQQVPSATILQIPTQTALPTVTSSRAPTHSPTSTITATPSPTATRTASSTRKPSLTPTITPTETPWPTNTPLVPAPQDGVQYRLTDWTPEKANQLIADLIAYPDGLSLMDQGKYGSLYYYAFRYAAMIQAESIIRFPHAAQVEKWNWGRLNNLNLASINVGELCASLILDALNNKVIGIDDLKSWFESHDHQLTLALTSLTPPAGYTNSQIVSIGNSDKYGLYSGTYIWLLQKNGKFSAYPLESEHDFSLVGNQPSLGIQDLTGDGIPEVIIKHLELQSFMLHSGSLEIYDLSQIPPQKLTLSPQPLNIETSDWSVLTENEQAVGISLQIPINIESGYCGRIGPTYDYRWDGTKFTLSRILPPTQEELYADPFCADLLISWPLMHYAKLGDAVAVELLKSQIEDYPFTAEYKTEYRNSDMIPAPDNELRFKFGLYLAFLGEASAAREQMENIIANSEITSSQWAETARQFLDTYQLEDNLLEACKATHKCYPYLDEETLTKLIPLDNYADSMSILQAAGITMTLSGAYDFDQDGNDEYLFVNKYNDYGFYNYWIIAKNSTQVYAQLVDTRNLHTDTDNIAISLQPLKPYQNDQVYLIDFSNSDIIHFIWHQEPKTNQYSAVGIEVPFNQSLDDNEVALFSSKNPFIIRDQLLRLFQYPFKEDDPKQVFLLALSYELTGDRKNAADTYLHLWQTYPDSPYAIMAKAKLEPVH